MKLAAVLLGLVLASASQSDTKPLTATTEDGRKVILASDGTWRFAAEAEKQAVEEVPKAVPIDRSKPRYVIAPIANVREGPSTKTAILHKCKAKDVLFQQSRKGEWVEVSWGTRAGGPGHGWIHRDLIAISEIEASLAASAATARADRQQIEAVVQNKRRQFVESHNLDPRFEQAILDGKIMLGMTKEMVIASWGKPNDINRTVTTGRVCEQWVYQDFGPYVYFENGVVTSWQD